MAKPLTIKNPEVPARWKLNAIGILLSIPIFGIFYFWRRHSDIHFGQPWLNMLAHATLVVIPLLFAFLISAPRMRFEQTDEEYLGNSSYFDTLPMDWWTMFMMWATPTFAALHVGDAFFMEYLKHPDALSTSPLRAVAILLVTFLLGLFYSTILTGNSEPQTLVSNAGIRPTLIRFFEWEMIHHISRRGELYSLYHRANPALPAASFRLRDPNSRATLERYIAEKQSPISNEITIQFICIQAGVLFGFALNLAISFWLRRNTTISVLWVLIISFAIATILTLAMERIRGVHKFGKHLPKIEPGQQEQTW